MPLSFSSHQCHASLPSRHQSLPKESGVNQSGGTTTQHHTPNCASPQSHLINTRRTAGIETMFITLTPSPQPRATPPKPVQRAAGADARRGAHIAAPQRNLSAQQRTPRTHSWSSTHRHCTTAHSPSLCPTHRLTTRPPAPRPQPAPFLAALPSPPLLALHAHTPFTQIPPSPRHPHAPATRAGPSAGARSLAPGPLRGGHARAANAGSIDPSGAAGRLAGWEQRAGGRIGGRHPIPAPARASECALG